MNHLLDKSYSTLGSVFLDYRNNIDDRKILIYGHNSQDIYTEFRFLENYLNYNYYLEHSDMYLRTVDNNYHYKIFSVYVAINDFRHVNLKFDDEGYAQHLQWLKDKSAYNTGLEVNKYDNVLKLLDKNYVEENNTSDNDIESQLMKLKKLYDKGMIDEKEYKASRLKILDL